MAIEIIVGKRGRMTIPACLRKKYNIEVGRLEIMETDEGFILLPKRSLWAMFWERVESGLDTAPLKAKWNLTSSGTKKMNEKINTKPTAQKSHIKFFPYKQLISENHCPIETCPTI